MKTTVKNSGNKNILITMSLVFAGLCAKAESVGVFFNGVIKDMSKDGGDGLYLIGGVLGFGVLLFIINKIALRFSKNEDDDQKNVRVISHRDRHHHRVIKKSA